MTTYRSTHRQRRRCLRARLVAAWLVAPAGHLLTAAGGVVGGVGIALGQGELVTLAGCAIALGLLLTTGASKLRRRDSD